MKKRIATKITNKMSDYKISQDWVKVKDKKINIVKIQFQNEIVCVITKVKDYESTLSLIKCMFESGLMYSSISYSELKRMYKVTEKSTFSKRINEVIEEVIDTVKLVKLENVVEKTIKVVKKWINTANLFPRISKSDIINSIVYKDPIQNLRFNLH